MKIIESNGEFNIYGGNSVSTYSELPAGFYEVCFHKQRGFWLVEHPQMQIKEASNKPLFWQFVGIGNSSFGFLEKLDDMDGRTVDNADFLKISNLTKLNDEDLYKALLGEFPDWLKAAKSKNIIK